MTHDVAVVGAGILGLATARELLRRTPGLRLVVLEKEGAIAAHQTGHNSGVIHSGLYYAPGSAKARLTVAGQRELYAYLAERGIAHERCGKLVVAVAEEELPRLAELERRGRANGVAGLETVDAAGIRAREPHCLGLRALWVPTTGIVDFTRVAEAYAAEVRAAGGEIRLGDEVVSLGQDASSVRLDTRADAVVAERAVICAGLWSDRLAVMAGAPREPRVVPFRGDYYVLRPERRALVRGLIYPVPNPSFPWLGVHFTRRPDGGVWLGPNAVLAFARAGYGRWDVDVTDLAEAIAYSGLRRLAARYWKVALFELARDHAKALFLRELRRFVPELEAGDLLPGPSGVRAQALDAEGRLVEDFVFDRVGRVLNVRNAPSPAATASLAIAREIVDQLAA